ncbi:MAG: ABC transporter permease [Ilumatobacteraceae bacterium]
MVLRRFLSIIPIVLAASFIVFCLEVFLPGDPAVSLAGPDASLDRIEQIRQSLQLDRPLIARYFDWLGDAVRGDLGTSLFTRRSVSDEILARWTVTGQLVTAALLLAIVVGVPLGMAAALRRGGIVDRLALVGAAVGAALPAFLLGIVLIVVFAVWLGWLPVAGFVPFGRSPSDWARSLVLPAVALSGLVIAELTRQVRSALIEVMEQDFVRMARAKGLPERIVVVKHGMRLAAQTAVTVLGVQAARLFGGALIVEQVFSLPGLGRYTIDAISNRDLPVLQGVVPVMVVIAVVLSVVADLGQQALNPVVAVREDRS